MGRGVMGSETDERKDDVERLREVGRAGAPPSCPDRMPWPQTSGLHIREKQHLCFSHRVCGTLLQRPQEMYKRRLQTELKYFLSCKLPVQQNTCIQNIYIFKKLSKLNS